VAKVLFVNPVVREEDVPRHIPYGIALLAAIADKKGHQVQIYDANAWRRGDDVLEQVFEADDWDVIAVGGLTTTYNYTKKCFKLAHRKCPSALKVAGGGFLTSMPLEILEWIPEIDVGVVGEAYLTFPEVLEKVDQGDLDFSSTLGVVHRDPDGKPLLNPVRPLLHDMDDLPWPAWDMLPLDIYFANSANLFSEEAFTSKRRIDVNGSLGCSLVCRYCWHLGTTGDMVIEKNDDGERDVVFSYGRSIRYHSPEYLVEMVRHLKDAYDIDFVGFLDENLFTMDASSGRTWLKALSKAWIEGGLQPTCRRDGVPHDENCRGVHWNGTSHAGLHRLDTLEAMYEAGCTHLVYGLESFDPKILKNLGKGTTVQKNLDSVELCLKSGIKPIPNIILGFPDESFDSVRNTIEGMKKCGITAKPHFATAYPGSEWYYTYKESIRAQYDGDLEAFVADLGDASSISGTISHNFTGMELLGLQQIMYKKDLRLLDQAEKAWREVAGNRPPVVQPRDSFNMRRKKIQAPVEEGRRSFETGTKSDSILSKVKLTT
jgi:radical SAM superfamily enzyme YgiQ (UPF0313 family)